ncbi:MAG TPA: histidine kinase [Burkholderiaceae bacterium]|nr:histidine kinase [Burkholderiaceae bacterium]
MNFISRLFTAVRDFWRKFGAGYASRQTFALGRSYNRLALWLTAVTWKRLFVIGILFLILSSLMSSVLDDLFSGRPIRPLVEVNNPQKKPMTIVIEADPTGVRVRSSEDPPMPKPPRPPAPPKAPMPPVIITKDGVNIPADPSAPNRPPIVINKDGIKVGKDGEIVKIDRDGIVIQPENAEKLAELERVAHAPMDEVTKILEEPTKHSDAVVARAAERLAELATTEIMENLPLEQRGEVVLEKDGLTVRVDKRGELPADFDAIIKDITQGIEEGFSGKNPNIKINHQEPRKFWLARSLTDIVVILIAALITLKVILNTQRKAEVKVAAAQSVAQAAQEESEREALKRQLVEAKLVTLQAQVEPHFLFNTLASVDHLIEVDPKRASQMQKNLIQYLRAAMPHMRDTTSNMGREAVLVESYLKILQFRMEERLSFTVDIPAGLRTAEVPPMMLLSLVENCIKHGLEPKPEGGHIDVKGEIADGKLRVTVSDTGLGFKEGMVPTSGTGVGLSNIRERLAMLYGSGASFTIGMGEINGQPGGTRAVIEIPYRLADVRSNASTL